MEKNYHEIEYMPDYIKGYFINVQIFQIYHEITIIIIIQGNGNFKFTYIMKQPILYQSSDFFR